MPWFLVKQLSQLPNIFSDLHCININSPLVILKKLGYQFFSKWNDEAIIDWCTIQGDCFFKQPVEMIPRSISITIAKV